jgi:hypothetical protein
MNANKRESNQGNSFFISLFRFVFIRQIRGEFCYTSHAAIRGEARVPPSRAQQARKRFLYGECSLAVLERSDRNPSDATAT